MRDIGSPGGSQAGKRAGAPGDPNGLIPVRIDRAILDLASTLVEALTTLVERYPDFPCLTIVERSHREQPLTLGALWERARSVHQTLVTHGLEPGGFVLLALPTGPELVSAYFGVMLAGGVPGLVATPSIRFANRGIYQSRVGRILEQSRARIVYAEAEVAELLATAPGFSGEAILVTPSENPPAGELPAIHRAPADGIATIQYSSGSTGTPKGILLTHQAMLNNIRAVRDGLDLDSTDVSVNWIPLYHDMGLIDAFLLPLLCGCRTILMPTLDFMSDPALWLWAVDHYRGTISWAPNFAYAYCAQRVRPERIEAIDLSSWRIAINAAEPVLAHTIDRFTERFRPHGFRAEAMTPAWGLAENVTIATAHPIGEKPRVEILDRRVLAADSRAETTSGPGLSSVAIGRCLPHCSIEVRDEAGQALSDRRVGEIWLKSDSLFSGYHRDPDHSARALKDGWLDTGDRGYLAEGDLYFIAREKDLLVVGGEKYAPHDIETIVNRVPGVREGCAVVFGVLTEARGTESLVAVVETREADETARSRLRQRIGAEVQRATGLLLSQVLLVPPGGVEKTTSGKLARKATHSRYAEQLQGI